MECRVCYCGSHQLLFVPVWLTIIWCLHYSMRIHLRSASSVMGGCRLHTSCIAQPIYNCLGVRGRQPEARVVTPQCAICALLSSRHSDVDCYGSIKHLTIFAEM